MFDVNMQILKMLDEFSDTEETFLLHMFDVNMQVLKVLDEFSDTEEDWSVLSDIEFSDIDIEL
jgi:hypothetical protein